MDGKEVLAQVLWSLQVLEVASDVGGSVELLGFGDAGDRSDRGTRSSRGG